MKKVIACLVLGVMVCGSLYTVSPAEAVIGGDWGVGYFIGNVVWGTVKGSYKAWNAPKGRKWDAFKKGYKEGTDGVDGALSGGFGGVVAK